MELLQLRYRPKRLKRFRTEKPDYGCEQCVFEYEAVFSRIDLCSVTVRICLNVKCEITILMRRTQKNVTYEKKRFGNPIFE